jgi:hypothetical protein
MAPMLVRFWTGRIGSMFLFLHVKKTLAMWYYVRECEDKT